MRKIPVPKPLFRLPKVIKKVMSPDELLSSDLWDIIALLANLRGKMSLEQSTNVGSYMQPLQQLDCELQGWASRLPPSWRYHIRERNFKHEVYPSHYSQYLGHTIATVWNHYRVARCLIQLTHLEYLQRYPGVDTGLQTLNLGQSTELESIIQMLCNDICATVPYFLQQTDQQGDSKPGIGAFEVVWPLFFCASITCLPSEQRLWARRKLYEIGSDMGIPMARQLADVMNPIFTADPTE
jgi:hypothetical protein